MKRVFAFAFGSLLILFLPACEESTNGPIVQDPAEPGSLEKKNKVVVCHRTGNGEFIPLEISINALPAHLAHGDYLPDGDDDGYTAIGACTGSADDCNDNDPMIYPGAEETCGDGIDNNCNGEIDEECAPPCPGIPIVMYEGKTYHTVLVGSQCWLRENLDAGTMVSGSLNQADNEVVEKYCYDNTPANCSIYGGLYQWNEAMHYLRFKGVQGICPPGWHVPTLADFQVLATLVNNDGNVLKAIGQGSGEGAGTNESGFAALLAGSRTLRGDISGLGNMGTFWSSTPTGPSAHDLGLSFNSAYISILPGAKDYGFSVRCIKD